MHDDKLMQSWPTRPGQEVRLVRKHYMGRDYLDLRGWYKNRDGELRPTRHGVILPAAKMGEVAAEVLATLESDPPVDENAAYDDSGDCGTCTRDDDHIDWFPPPSKR